MRERERTRDNRRRRREREKKNCLLREQHKKKGNYVHEKVNTETDFLPYLVVIDKEQQEKVQECKFIFHNLVHIEKKNSLCEQYNV